MIDDRNYYSDHRVRAGERRGMFARVDVGRRVGYVRLDPNSTEETEVPINFEVCPTCEGRGTHVNPSVDAGGLTAEDFAEDPDFAEAYMGGHYDVACYGCKGERVVPALARDRCNPEVVKRLDQMEEAESDFRREREAERRFGC